MTKETLAALLNGRDQDNIISRAEENNALNHELVVVYGASDDLMELRGAIYEEYGCNDGGDILFTKAGKEITDDIREKIEELEEELGCAIPIPNVNKITANWCPEDANGASWTYTTEIPHSTFEAFEDGELYCVGIVFSVTDLK